MTIDRGPVHIFEAAFLVGVTTLFVLAGAGAVSLFGSTITDLLVAAESSVRYNAFNVPGTLGLELSPPA